MKKRTERFSRLKVEKERLRMPKEITKMERDRKLLFEKENMI